MEDSTSVLDMVQGLTLRENSIRAAAMIDTDGCILIMPAPKYGVRCIFTSTTLPLSQWLFDNYGGQITYRKNENRPDGFVRKPRYDWTISHKSAAAFIREIRPYLLIKGPQADCAIELRTHQGYAHRRIPQSKKEAIWKMYSDRMHQLNR